MTFRLLLLLMCCGTLLSCEGFPAQRPVINSGSYDWTDQVRDARGFPLPGWGTAVFGSGGFGDGSR
jgi:hypothetical protein